MPLGARRVFRFALVTALSATAAFALQLEFSLLPPVMAILLSLKPAPPMRPAALLVLVLVILFTTGIGLLLPPLLLHYPFTGVLLVAVGLYVSSRLMVSLGQDALGLFLATGFVLVSSLGLVSESLAWRMVESMAGSVVIVLCCQWLVHPLFPEDAAPTPAPPPDAAGSDWIALRSTLLVLPVWLAALTDPSTWMAALTRLLTLGQQRSFRDVRRAGTELVGSTFAGGLAAVVLWGLLKPFPHLWMLFLLALALGIWGGSRLYGVKDSPLPPSFWSGTLVTAWILLAPATADAAGGRDVYAAFFLRFTVFLMVTLYAWVALTLLEQWRERRTGTGSVQRFR